MYIIIIFVHLKFVKQHHLQAVSCVSYNKKKKKKRKITQNTCFYLLLSSRTFFSKNNKSLNEQKKFLLLMPLCIWNTISQQLGKKTIMTRMTMTKTTNTTTKTVKKRENWVFIQHTSPFSRETKISFFLFRFLQLSVYWLK